MRPPRSETILRQRGRDDRLVERREQQRDHQARVDREDAPDREAVARRGAREPFADRRHAATGAAVDRPVLRESRIPAAIVMPPRSGASSSISERISTEKKAARKGCRLAKSEAREGPTRLIALNQSRFVGHERAEDGEGEREPDQARRSRSPAWRAAGSRRSSSGTVPITNASALIRSVEYRLRSGATATEYHAQVAAAAKPSTSPQSWPDTPPPEPIATSAAPTNASSGREPEARAEALDPEREREDPVSERAASRRAARPSSPSSA